MANINNQILNTMDIDMSYISAKIIVLVEDTAIPFEIIYPDILNRYNSSIRGNTLKVDLFYGVISYFCSPDYSINKMSMLVEKIVDNDKTLISKFFSIRVNFALRKTNTELAQTLLEEYISINGEDTNSLSVELNLLMRKDYSLNRERILEILEKIK